MTQQRKKFLKEKLFDLYRKLYKAATPSADFDELVRTANWERHNNLPNNFWSLSKEEQDEIKKNFNPITSLPADSMTEEEAKAKGFQKKIDWDSYWLDKDEYSKIVEDFINDKNNKLTKIEKMKFRTEAYLGCGPTTCSRKEREKELNDKINS